MVTRFYSICTGALLVAGFSACGGESTRNPIREAFAQQGPQTPPGINVAFRFPRDANQSVRLYTLPGLEPVNIEFTASETGTREYIGFVREEDLIYTRNAKNELSALDLTAGRFRTVDSLVSRAIISPTGVPIVVHADQSVASVRNRVLDRWPTRFPHAPSQAWGTLGSGLLAIFDLDAGPAASVVTREWDERLVSLPFGPVATTRWGDMLIVATDSGLVSIDPRQAAPSRFLPLSADVTAIALSPSAHRVYVALSTGELVIVNRFELTTLETLELQSPVSALRPDPWGRYLLMRPASGNTIWIAPIDDIGEVRSTTGEWTDQLPDVAPDGTVIVRNGGEILAIDPMTAEAVGRVPDPSGDTWALLVWDPRRPALQVAAERSSRSARSSNGVQFYAQVSSTSNLNWAQDEVNRLNQAGLPAALLPQSAFDDRYRVGLGPFATREEAEDSGRILGRPFFVVSIDPDNPNQ